MLGQSRNVLGHNDGRLRVVESTKGCLLGPDGRTHFLGGQVIADLGPVASKIAGLAVDHVGHHTLVPFNELRNVAAGHVRWLCVIALLVLDGQNNARLESAQMPKNGRARLPKMMRVSDVLDEEVMGVARTSGSISGEEKALSRGLVDIKRACCRDG